MRNIISSVKQFIVPKDARRTLANLLTGRQDRLIPFGKFNVEIHRPDGRIHHLEFPNLVVDTGKDLILDCLDGQATGATLYVGLTDGTPSVAATDTLASNPGWDEVTDYTESVRQTWSGAASSGQSRTNSASKAVFSINATVTVGGLFIATANTKSETASILVSAGAFQEGDFSLNSGSTLNCTWTLSL